ncbi:hypothetical protein D3C76_763700 [compost metagenome]
MEITNINQLGFLLIWNKRKLLLIQPPNPVKHLNIRAFSHGTDQKQMFVLPLLIHAKRKQHRKLPDRSKIRILLKIRLEKRSFVRPVQHILRNKGQRGPAFAFDPRSDQGIPTVIVLPNKRIAEISKRPYPFLLYDKRLPMLDPTNQVRVTIGRIRAPSKSHALIRRSTVIACCKEQYRQTLRIIRGTA